MPEGEPIHQDIKEKSCVIGCESGRLWLFLWLCMVKVTELISNKIEKTYALKILILMTSLCEVGWKTGPGANKSKQKINCIGTDLRVGGRPPLNQSSPVNRYFFFSVPTLLTIGTCFLSTVQRRICPMSQRHVWRSNIYLSSLTFFFFWRGGFKNEREREN